MRVKATCSHCGREFLFFQLYNAGPADADRCPHCGRLLGVVGLQRLALAVDRAASDLVHALHEIAVRSPGLTVDAESVLRPIAAAVGEQANPAGPVVHEQRVGAPA